MNIEISVIICTFNPKEEYINKTIDSILQQNFSKEKWEFFIIDNNSSFKVSELPKVKENNIRVIEEKTSGLTAARECGAKNANGEIIVFVDDDNILRNDYLSNVLYLFNQYTDLGVVSGEILPIFEVEPPKWFYHFENTVAIRRIPTGINYFTRIPIYNEFFPIGAGMSLRKNIILDYFDDLKNNIRIEGRKGGSLSSGEDLDIDFFAIYKGFEIGQSKKLNMKHIIPAERLNYKYIKRLNAASLISSYLISKKWNHRFKSPIFTFFNKNKYFYFLKVILLFPLSFNKIFGIKYHNNLNLYRTLNTEL